MQSGGKKEGEWRILVRINVAYQWFAEKQEHPKMTN